MTSSSYGIHVLQNKERERLREQENALREREARYSNGHLFTSLTVSGTTLCSACNKSITAKEALSCSSKDTNQMLSCEEMVMLLKLRQRSSQQCMKRIMCPNILSVDDVCVVFQRVMSLSTTDAETLWPTVPK